jgi:hypothetical protein
METVESLKFNYDRKLYSFALMTILKLDQLPSMVSLAFNSLL